MIGLEVAILLGVLLAIAFVVGGLAYGRRHVRAQQIRLDLERTRHVEYEAHRQIQAITREAIERMFAATSLGQDSRRSR